MDLYDNHMHTRFSGDSDADPVEMIAAAREKGLRGITFTDHLDWDFYYEPGYFDLDFDEYFKVMNELKEKYSSKDFSIKIGLELGLQTHLCERHNELLDKYSFDLVIGSIHQIHKKDPYYDYFWEGKSIEDAYREFLDVTLENINAFGRFDTLGHLDYIARYGMRVAKERGCSGELLYDDFSEQIDAILSLIIEKNIALEINTAPFKYGFREPNPSRPILKRYKKLGGRNVTTGADAHRPEHVAIGFEILPKLIAENDFHVIP